MFKSDYYIIKIITILIWMPLDQLLISETRSMWCFIIRSQVWFGVLINVKAKLLCVPCVTILLHSCHTCKLLMSSNNLCVLFVLVSY